MARPKFRRSSKKTLTLLRRPTTQLRSLMRRRNMTRLSDATHPTTQLRNAIPSGDMRMLNILSVLLRRRRAAGRNVRSSNSIVLGSRRQRRLLKALLLCISRLVVVRSRDERLRRLLLGELGFCVGETSNASRGMRGIRCSHGGAALLGRGMCFILVATEEKPDECADEGKTDERANDCTSNPGFGAFLLRRCA
jgi:hypothetical protein